MTDDEHIAELQRMAYGASTPDAVRARASADLAELAAAAAARGSPSATDGVVQGPPDPAAADPAAADPAAADPAAAAAARERARTRSRRRIVIAGVASLLVGAAVGAAITRGVPAESGPAPGDIAPAAPAFGSGERSIPLGEIDIEAVFDRLPTVADVGQLDQALSGIDPASIRLLGTRADGPAAYLARTADGADVCLILLVAPDGWAQSRCTLGGLMPAGGLRIRHASPTEGFVVAILNSTGTITLGRATGR